MPYAIYVNHTQLLGEDINVFYVKIIIYVNNVNLNIIIDIHYLKYILIIKHHYKLM